MDRLLSLHLSAAFAVFVVSAGAYAQGIPTISTAELAQDIVMVQNLQQQLQTMASQYQTMTHQLSALTGNRGLGQIFNDPSLHSYLPDQWYSIYSNIKGGELSGLSGMAQRIEQDEGMTATTPGQQRYIDTIAANKAMTMQAYQQILSRLQNIESLMQQSDLTQDPAAKADLQNRLLSENAMIQNEQTRLNQMSNLQRIEQQLADQQAQSELHSQIAR